ncbi:MAG: imidazole glycerol phosphate synthase subunit HisH [Rhodanobacteraceae bacterium]|nr:imidazole glycerol phosphate synthase subunit HisH [Rhodanobacteraceae bacterium]
MSTVVVVDSGVANIGSVVAALERAQASVSVSRDWDVIRAAPRVLLPGVGSAAAAMRELHALGLAERLPTLTQPVLGICLGMQLLFEGSEEGGDASGAVECLSILPGDIRRLPESPGVRIPHMGWNALIPCRDHPLVAGLGRSDYAYFVHSFAVAESALTLMACEHGQRFSAIVACGNFMGAQFHPERSAAVGARLLRNFLNLGPGDLPA